MPGLGLGEIAQQLAGGGVGGGRRRRGCRRPPPRFPSRSPPRGCARAEVLDQPDGRRAYQPATCSRRISGITSPKRRPVQLDQALAVVVFLLRHAVEQLGAVREVAPQALGVAAVDAGVVLFGGDGERQHLLFGKIAEAAAVGHEAHGRLRGDGRGGRPLDPPCDREVQAPRRADVAGSFGGNGGRPWNRTRHGSPRRSYSPLPHLAARRPTRWGG
jgi:hypothetical protein